MDPSWRSVKKKSCGASRGEARALVAAALPRAAPRQAVSDPLRIFANPYE